MLRVIEHLIAHEHAYVGGDGTVYFDSQSFPSYGALSGNKLAELRASNRGDLEEIAKGKRFHADWALWKTAVPGREMTWDSPWGSGFPGWHIECSAMSLDLLGDTIDIHTGGIDLRFPHHEDERAQSNCYAGKEVVRHWVHGEHLLFEGRKMAKSTGNVVLVADVIERGFDPLALRLAFLSSRYRQQANLSWDAIAGAQRTLTRWRARVAEAAEHPSAPLDADVKAAVLEAFSDDLDTPRALQVLRGFERSDASPGCLFETFAWADRLLGLDLAREVGKGPAALPPGAQQLLERRARARAERDFAASDALRDQLAELGLPVKDGPDGQTWD